MRGEPVVLELSTDCVFPSSDHFCSRLQVWQHLHPPSAEMPDSPVLGGIWKDESRPLAHVPSLKAHGSPNSWCSRIPQHQPMESPHCHADKNLRASPQVATESFGCAGKQASLPSREGGDITANRQRQKV